MTFLLMVLVEKQISKLLLPMLLEALWEESLLLLEMTVMINTTPQPFPHLVESVPIGLGQNAVLMVLPFPTFLLHPISVPLLPSPAFKEFLKVLLPAVILMETKK
jgi:hypothetical protein